MVPSLGQRERRQKALGRRYFPSVTEVSRLAGEAAFPSVDDSEAPAERKKGIYRNVVSFN